MKKATTQRAADGALRKNGFPRRLFFASRLSPKAISLLGLAIALCALVAIWSSLRLNTVIRIGADEDYELSKGLLAARGFQFYTEIWNDQPLLHTELVAAILKNFSLSPAGPRLLTAGFSLLMVVSLFGIAGKLTGSDSAAMAALLLIASPGFVDLSSSCMVEVPALSTALASLFLLTNLRERRPWLSLVLSGVVFGVSLQIKLINLILLPIVFLILATPAAESQKQLIKKWFHSFKSLRLAATQFFILMAVAGATFLAITFLLGQSTFWLQLTQTWTAHFAATRSFEYGSPADHLFDWGILLKNWDQTIPALVGIGVSLRVSAQNIWFIAPVAWFFLELAVFGSHKPWWSYYYIHNAVPISWLGGIGFAAIWKHLSAKPHFVPSLLAGLFSMAAFAWMASRVGLQVKTIRDAPQTYNSLALQEIKRYRPFAKFMYAEEAAYSFHADIPLPPKLAVVSLKRFWSGDLTNQKLALEMARQKPELILVKNEARLLPYQTLLVADYALVYQDSHHSLYAAKNITPLVKW